jgi:predicted transcriptional regulator
MAIVNMGYTPGMKTAVSVPTPVFEKADRLARRLKKSRSQLYSEALCEYLERHDSEAITSALDAIYASVESRPDDFVREAARRVLRSSDW